MLSVVKCKARVLWSLYEGEGTLVWPGDQESLPRGVLSKLNGEEQAGGSSAEREDSLFQACARP